ncbi:MAG: putative 2-aminoethylphosphonate ABC transporter substrate-binding protein [Rhodospirillales bacterium]|nr:MAG: putative 2-aminoethylphosphonate ABC transporter substrate-binding protein [Rhodospirillales bacterium]
MTRAALAALALGVVALAGPAVAQKTKLTIYTALENDQLKPVKDAIEKAVPTVEVAWVRDSTGVITARFLAEKANPQADMVVGVAASSMALFAKQGLLLGYTPTGADQLRPSFRPAASPTPWIGMDAYVSVICYNTVEGGKKNAPKPASWKDLTNPAFKDQIVMPNPASSGTGYLTIAAWLQTMGEEAGWKFMDALHANVGVYTHSGSAPCVQAAKGERIVGIGFDMRGAREKTAGAPIDLILAKEGAGWEMEAAGIVTGRAKANEDAAKLVMNWLATKEANELYGKFYAITAHPGVSAAPPNYPPGAVEAMVKNDLDWMATNRERILAEWTKRYDGKSAPKPK